jgi:RNA polymerase sigma factor (sigma-70 family)
VRAIARRVSHRVPRSIDLEDLVQAGVVGLLDAARHYDGSVPFSAYARLRIRGEILDYVRREFAWTAETRPRDRARELPARQPDTSTGPRGKRIASLMRAVAALPRAERRILQMIYSRNLTAQEVAREGVPGMGRGRVGSGGRREAGTPIRTSRRVEQLHRRALDTLRRKLKPAA